MPTSHPNFMIIGAARCGTTALAQYLGQHPDVFFCEPKEPHFCAFAGRSPSFQGPGDDTMINRAAITDPSAYLALFEPGRHHAAVGEGSVSTLYYHQHSIEVIKQHVPDVKFIVMLRNPIERAYSNFLYTSSRGFEPEDDFQVALDDEQRRIADNWHHLWHYKQMGYYCEPLGHFQQAFGNDRVKIVLFDAFQENPQRVVQDLFRYLEVDPNFAPDTSIVMNRSGTARLWPVRLAMNAAYQRPLLKAALKSLFPMRFRERIRNASLTRPSIPEQSAQSLRDIYTDEVRSLSELLQQDLTHWLAGKRRTTPA